MSNIITVDEFREYARDLEVHHGIFSRVWQMGRPVSTPEIPTACVTFDREGNYFGFCFNPDYWNSLDDYNRKFIFCHEALHVILKHGARFKNKIAEVANLAADVVINESLVRSFGFDRNRIQNHDKLCWYDTVFKEIPHDIDRSFEYYYELLMKSTNMVQVIIQGGGGKTVDEHKGFGSEADDIIDELINEACDSLSDQEIDDLKKKIESKVDEDSKKSKQAGAAPGGLERIIAKTKIVKKRKWETVIRRWTQKYLRFTDKPKDQWARVNRRFVTLDEFNNGSLCIPTEMETESYDDEKCRINVMFFLDTSGSCAHLADRFWKAAESLPEDRFNITLCCFDTQVYETDFKSRKLYGFGGTSFTCIEQYIINKIKNKRYPEAVFVITDGYGDVVNPKVPENWYWFLSEKYTHCIPKTSKTFMLQDYE